MLPSFSTEISKNEEEPSFQYSFSYFRMVEIFEDDLTQLSYSAVKNAGPEGNGLPCHTIVWQGLESRFLNFKQWFYH